MMKIKDIKLKKIYFLKYSLLDYPHPLLLSPPSFFQELELELEFMYCHIKNCTKLVQK